MAQPRSINFETELGFRHAGFPLDNFKTSSNPSVHVTSVGSIPSLICFSGGGKYAIPSTRPNCDDTTKMPKRIMSTERFTNYLC
jgi:hypothetical protein